MPQAEALKKIIILILAISALAYKPIALILAVALVAIPDWVIWLLRLVYGEALAPGLSRVPSLGDGRVRRWDGVEYAFYKVNPLLDISSQGVKALNAFTQMLSRLELTGIELTIARLGDVKIIRIGYRHRADLDRVIPILKQYFTMEPLKNVERVIGSIEPVPRVWLLAPIILVVLYGIPLRLNWLYGLILGIAGTVSMLRMLPRLSINRSPVRFGVSLASNDAIYMIMNPEDYLPITMGNAGTQYWALSITEDPGLRGLIENQYSREREKAVVRQRGRAEAKAGRLWNTIQRLNNGERTYLIDIHGPIKAPGIRMGMPRNWFTPPMHGALTNDVLPIPVFHGANLATSLARAIIEVGVDRFGNRVSIDLDALGNAHALIVGPSGRGKTKTTMSLIMRMLGSGVRFLILDPEGEYCPVLANYGFQCLYAGESFIDYLAPINEDPTVKASYIRDAVKASLGFDDPAIISLYNQPYRSLPWALDWLVANSPYRDAWIIARRLMPRRLVSLESLLGENTVITFTRANETLRQYDPLVSLMMQAMIGEAFNHFLARGRSSGELVTNILIADEAYLILGSRAVWSLIRAGRKRGLALWFATQSITDAPPGALQNLGFSIILAGPDAYIDEVYQKFGLTNADREWLRMDLTPRLLGEYAMGILYSPPASRHVFIRLEENALQA